MLLPHIFHATNVAMKFAIVPPKISIGPKFPTGFNVFAINVPSDKPITTGIPNIMESGNNASAILT